MSLVCVAQSSQTGRSHACSLNICEIIRVICRLAFMRARIDRTLILYEYRAHEELTPRILKLAHTFILSTVVALTVCLSFVFVCVCVGRVFVDIFELRAHATRSELRTHL